MPEIPSDRRPAGGGAAGGPRDEFGPRPNPAMTAYGPAGAAAAPPEVPERAAWEIDYATPDGVRHACHVYWMRRAEWGGRAESREPGWLVLDVGAFVMVRFCGLERGVDDLLPAFEAAGAGGTLGGG